MIRPRFDLSAAIRQYVHDTGSSFSKFARTAGVSENPVYDIIHRGDEGCEVRQICVLERILAVLGHTLDDYDPQIRQGLVALPEIQRLLDRFSANELSKHMGFAYSTGLEYTLNKIQNGMSEQVTYQNACRLAMVFDEGFEAGMQPYRKSNDECTERPVFGVTSINKAAKLHGKAGEALLRGVAGTIMMPSLLNGAEYDVDADMLRFQSATGLYRFEVTKHELVAIWANTGEVSMRRAIT